MSWLTFDISFHSFYDMLTLQLLHFYIILLKSIYWFNLLTLRYTWRYGSLSNSHPYYTIVQLLPEHAPVESFWLHPIYWFLTTMETLMKAEPLSVVIFYIFLFLLYFVGDFVNCISQRSYNFFFFSDIFLIVFFIYLFVFYVFHFV